MIRPKRSESTVSFDNPSSPPMIDTGVVPMETDSSAVAGSDVNQGASTSADIQDPLTPPDISQDATTSELDSDLPSVMPATLVSADGKSKSL